MSDGYPTEDLVGGEGFDFDVGGVGGLSLGFGDGLDLLPYGGVVDGDAGEAVLAGGEGGDPCEYEDEWQFDHCKITPASGECLG